MKHRQYLEDLDMVYGCFVVNKARVQHKRPHLYGVSQLRSMATTIAPGETPCLAYFNAEGSKFLNYVKPLRR
jgi:hypothetical protein